MMDINKQRESIEIPFFSIVTICWNAVEDLKRTSESVEKQIYRNFEWIVIDGGSEDETLDFIKDCKEVSQWISEPDKGIYDAWNKGIKLSKGEYVLILNAGDTYTEDALITYSENVFNNVITCASARVVCQDKISDKAVKVFRSKPHLLYKGMYVPHNWCAVPLGIYEEFGLYRHLEYSMDYDWFARYFKVKGNSGFNVIDNVLGVYSLGGLSDINYKESFLANERIIKELGVHPLMARYYRLTSTFKHYLSNILVSLNMR